MKDTLSILKIFLLLFLVGSCTSDVLTDVQSGKGQYAIGFDNGMVDNNVLTRATTTPLSLYHPTMGVWGWEIAANKKENPLFHNQQVNYVAEGTDYHNWTYSPLKYWNNDCNYRFYAYAPYDSTLVSIVDSTGAFRIRDIVLTGVNLQDSATTTLRDCFSGTKDIDWMVARNGEFLPGTNRDKVSFTMQHILAKFVAAVRVDKSLAESQDVTKVTVNSLTIDDFVSKGSFEQKYTYNPDTTNIYEADEWILDETAARYTLAMSQPAQVLPDQTMYLMESLLLPQTVEEEATITLNYSYTYSDGRTERFLYTTPLTKAFLQFSSCCCYTLTFVINPECIVFDAGVNNWQDVSGGEKSIE